MRKSRDFIVVPRNLLVKLNALEKQTDEKYFENLKNHRWARRKNTNDFPSSLAWKTHRVVLEMFIKVFYYFSGFSEFLFLVGENSPKSTTALIVTLT